MSAEQQAVETRVTVTQLAEESRALKWKVKQLEERIQKLLVDLADCNCCNSTTDQGVRSPLQHLGKHKLTLLILFHHIISTVQETIDISRRFAYLSNAIETLLHMFIIHSSLFEQENLKKFFYTFQIQNCLPYVCNAIETCW